MEWKHRSMEIVVSWRWIVQLRLLCCGYFLKSYPFMGTYSSKMAAQERVERSGALRYSLDFFVIHEIYDGDFTQAEIEAQLEAALEHQYCYIVIELAQLGTETARWIAVGNCLHRTSEITGAICLLSLIGLSDEFSHYLCLPAGVVSVACAALYGVSWQFDPCCKYQVDRSGQQLTRIPAGTLRTTSPVVLVRHDDTQRLHNVIAMTPLAYCTQNLFELFME